METKQVIVVRKDLHMRKGKIAAQCTHTTKLLFIKRLEEQCIDGDIRHHSFITDVGSPFDNWLKDLFTTVVVSCNSEEELLQLRDKANEVGVESVIVQDSGKTEFHDVLTYTVLSIGPDEVSKVDKITGHLKPL